MSQLMFLERFDNTVASPADETTPEDLPGYAQGFAAGQAAAETRAARLDQAVVQALSDLSFGYVEAHQHIMASLTPLFQALAETVLPAVGDDILALQVLDQLQLAATTDAATPVRIAVPPDQKEGLEACLKEGLALPVEFFADPQIPAGQAIISAAHVETTLNADGLIKSIQGILAMMPDSFERTERHG